MVGIVDADGRPVDGYPVDLDVDVEIVTHRHTGECRHYDDLPPSTMEDAARLYEASSQFLADALDFLSATEDELPSALRAAVTEWYRTTSLYSTILEDLMAGDR